MDAVGISRVRRVGGWGFEDAAFPPSPQLLAWLEERLGPGTPVRRTEPASITPPPTARLPELPGALSTEPMDRLAHARGQGLPDILRVRAGRVPAWPDAVIRPTNPDDVEALLTACSRSGIHVVPWGGGTSVTGGVNPAGDESPSVTVDLTRLQGLLGLDTTSRLATFAAGTTGPQVESALSEHGLTLGHFPQSWELSTVGGWVVTRSSGQESLGYGRIDDMVAGLEAVAPAGRLSLPAQPGSAAGPDLRRLLLGSEGRLGIVTSATLRVRPRPPVTEVVAILVPSWNAGTRAGRELVQAGVPLTMIRLSDAPETEVAMAIGLASSRAERLVRTYLRVRGIGPASCLLLAGAAGEPEVVRSTLGCAKELVRRHRGVVLGRRPGRRWLADRFRHPYLRDGLLDAGYATDTLETAATWSSLDTVRSSVTAAVTSALAANDERVALLCHVSHPYRDGASLYFTFFYRAANELESDLARWASIKRSATVALAAAGATVSHHHGVGRWHAPWLEREVGALGLELIRAAAERMDPAGVLNPAILLDPTDRLVE